MARSTGRSPSRWRSAPSCSREPTSASSGRTRAAGPSPSAMPRSSTTPPATQYVPLCHLDGATGRYTVRDSLLSEYAGLGFEYGYSVERPETLVAWEAQFGDFVNGAEIIIDNFLVARRGQVGPAREPRAPAPPRLRGTGPGALERTHRALPVAVRAQQPARRDPLDRSAVLPPAAQPGPPGTANAAHLLHPQVPPASGVPPARRSPRSPMVGSARCRRRTVTTPQRSHGSCSDRARSPTRPSRTATRWCPPARSRATRSRSSVSSSSTRGRSSTLRGPRPLRGGRRTSCWLQEEPENMGPWPFVHHQLHRSCAPRTACTTSRVPSPRARRRAARSCTKRSRPTCSGVVG